MFCSVVIVINSLSVQYDFVLKAHIEETSTLKNNRFLDASQPKPSIICPYF